MTNQPTDPTTPAPPDNQRSGDQQSPPALIVALRAGRPEHTPEAEAVLILRDGEHVTLILDDGERLEFDASELQHAVEGP